MRRSAVVTGMILVMLGVAGCTASDQADADPAPTATRGPAPDPASVQPTYQAADPLCQVLTRYSATYAAYQQSIASTRSASDASQAAPSASAMWEALAAAASDADAQGALETLRAGADDAATYDAFAALDRHLVAQCVATESSAGAGAAKDAGEIRVWIDGYYGAQPTGEPPRVALRWCPSGDEPAEWNLGDREAIVARDTSGNLIAIRITNDIYSRPGVVTAESCESLGIQQQWNVWLMPHEDGTIPDLGELVVVPDSDETVTLRGEDIPALTN